MHSKKEVIVAAIDTGKRWSKSGMYDENEEVIRLQTSTIAGASVPVHEHPLRKHSGRLPCRTEGMGDKDIHI